jgi:hypothetical protein
MIYDGDFTGNIVEYRHMEFILVGKSPQLISSLTPAMSYTAYRGLPHTQKLLIVSAENFFLHCGHSRWEI